MGLGGGVPGGLSGAVGVPGKEQILAAVRQQVEYYFSVENLVKDVFLRSKMDAEGWIPLPVIAGFNRIRMMTPEPSMVLEAIRGSLIVEIAEVGGADGFRVRKMTDWKAWVVPGDGDKPGGLPTIVSQQQLDVGGLDAARGGDETAPRAKAAGKPPMAPVAEGDKATTPASADKQSSQSAKVEKSIEDEFEMFEMDEDLEGDKAKAAARATAGAQNRSASDAEEDYGDDVITDEDIGRLMIVTSRGGRGVHSRGGGGGSGSGKGLPPRDESANAAINEGLRFYQRELRGGGAGGESWKRGGGSVPSGAQTGSWRGGQHFFPSSFKESGMGSYSGGDDIGWLLGTTPTGDGDATASRAAARLSGRAPGATAAARRRRPSAGARSARPRFIHRKPPEQLRAAATPHWGLGLARLAVRLPPGHPRVPAPLALAPGG